MRVCFISFGNGHCGLLLSPSFQDRRTERDEEDVVLIMLHKEKVSRKDGSLSLPLPFSRDDTCPYVLVPIQRMPTWYVVDDEKLLLQLSLLSLSFSPAPRSIHHIDRASLPWEGGEGKEGKESNWTCKYTCI